MKLTKRSEGESSRFVGAVASAPIPSFRALRSFYGFGEIVIFIVVYISACSLFFLANLSDLLMPF